jgi:serine/threonine protein phosphatase PrpC
MHTGDSALYKCSPEKKRIEELTRSNFWMAGKIDRLFQVALIDILPDVFLLLTTDGISDLARLADNSGSAETDRIIYSHPVEEIPRKLIEAVMKGCGSRDDAAILSVFPRRLPPSGRRILLEGG